MSKTKIYKKPRSGDSFLAGWIYTVYFWPVHRQFLQNFGYVATNQVHNKDNPSQIIMWVGKYVLIDCNKISSLLVLMRYIYAIYTY